jgi:outer membrane lipoprotein-sorting protein
VKEFTSGAACLVWFLATAAQAATPPAESTEPWTVLQAVRKSLVDAGPVEATFIQTYVPAGFTSGESESGRLALSLPDCLRWDYLDPTPKVFLLCGDMVHAWNPGDKTGRRYRIDRAHEPGLDLRLLGVDDLKGRYQATESQEQARWVVSLTPRAGSANTKKEGEIADARLVVDPATHRIVEVSYHDVEGNATRFTIARYEALGRPGQFSPPTDIQWEEP